MNRNRCLTMPNQNDIPLIEPFRINSPNNMTILNTTMSGISSNNKSNVSVTNTTNSDSNISDIIQIPLFALLIILAVAYIILVLSRKTLRTNKFNWLTMNVCFASIFFAFIQLLSISIRLNNTSEKIISCRSRGFIVNMAACCIMYTHFTASFCRLLSIKYPHKPLFRSFRWLLSCISVSWIIGFVVALPYLFLDGFACSSSSNKRFLQIYTSISTILLPIIIVAICNIAIFRHVRQSTKRLHDLNNNNNANQFSKRDMYLCKIIFLTFSIFVIGWTPLFIQQIFFNDQNRLSSGVITLFKILPATCLFADILLLIYSDHAVRKLLLKAFKCHTINNT